MAGHQAENAPQASGERSSSTSGCTAESAAEILQRARNLAESERQKIEKGERNKDQRKAKLDQFDRDVWVPIDRVTKYGEDTEGTKLAEGTTGCEKLEIVRHKETLRRYLERAEQGEDAAVSRKGKGK